MTGVDQLWERLTGTQPLPSTAVVLVCAAIALALVLLPGVWPLTRHVVTVAHEGGHAVAAVLSGRRLTGIRLHSDTSGLTLSRGRPRGIGMVVTLLAGYTGPAVLGLGCAVLLAQGRAVALLWGLLLLLALLLLQIRNLFGLWVVLVCGLALVAVTSWAPQSAQSAVAWTLTWFLLFAAPRTVVELGRSRRGGAGRTSDADQLGRLTHLPGGVWVVVFGILTLAAVGAGAALLVPDVVAAVVAARP